MIALMYLNNKGDYVFKDLKTNNIFSVINDIEKKEKDLLKYELDNDWEDVYEFFSNKNILANFIKEAIKNYENQEFEI